MAWNYVDFSNQAIQTVLGAALGHLQTLPASAANSSKVASSDQEDGDARSLVVWNDDGTDPPTVPPGTTWGFYVWHTRSDFVSMYQGLVDSLNRLVLPDQSVLTPAQAFYSLVCMSNMKNGDATLAIYWRQ